ncbi:MAG TPA: VOC family protein [Chthonomonadales bacterium]|nr:VOC family protein [Chthonomonadales bacterium]
MEATETEAIPRGKVLGVSELALWTDDLERAITFYRDKPGFEVTDVQEGKHAFLRSGSLVLALFNPAMPGTQLAENYLARTGKPQGEVYHIGFQVAPTSLDSFADSLRAGGLEVKGPVEFATGRRSYFLEDPDRHYLELTDR